MYKLKHSISMFLTLLMLLSVVVGSVPLTVGATSEGESEYKTTTKLKAGETATIKTDAKVKSWSSSDKSVVTVRNGEVTALKKGTAIITSTLVNGDNDKHKITVTTNPKIVGKKTKAEKYYTFRIKVEGAATKVKYSSSKPKVATITSKGEISTLKVGTTTIKAKVNGVVLSFKLKVYIKDIVNHYTRTLYKGTTNTLYFSEVGLTPKIVSDNPKIVKVTKSGELKALKKGKATLTFSRKHAKAIVKIKVV